MGAADPHTPPIVVPIFVRDPEQTIRQMQQAAHEGADWIELRCDEAWNPGGGTAEGGVGGGLHEKVRRVLQARPHRDGQLLPLIITYRSQAEGGGFAGTDADLAEALLQAAHAGVEYLDVEFAAWRRSESLRQKLREILASPEHPHGPRMILSAHDFTGRPADLHERIAAMGAEPAAAVIKMAWHAAAIPDALEALQLVAEAPRKYGRPLLALTMGEFGQLARLLGAKFGQPFTFATLGQGTQSAPGQPSIQELKDTYRWAAQHPETSVYGVIGWPVGHSLSPAIHNAGFAATGFDGVYVPLPIEPSYESFASTVDALRTCPGMNLRGLSVTIPHKENALRYVRDRSGGGGGGQIDPLSAHIGAINTIVFQSARPTILGVNSDYSGAMEALRGGLKQAGILPDAATSSLDGIRVAVLGAGGAARAIIAGLAHANATSVIYNRTLEKAQQLAAEFTGTPGKVVAVDLERLCLSCCQVYINCTPLGMHPHTERCPVSDEIQFTPGTVVFDTIYNPLETQLLKRAKAAGATTVPGLEMFVRQAGVQFKLFTGQEPPLELFRTIALERLSPGAGLGK